MKEYQFINEEILEIRKTLSIELDNYWQIFTQILENDKLIVVSGKIIYYIIFLFWFFLFPLAFSFRLIKKDLFTNLKISIIFFIGHIILNYFVFSKNYLLFLCYFFITSLISIVTLSIVRFYHIKKENKKLLTSLDYNENTKMFLLSNLNPLPISLVTFHRGKIDFNNSYLKWRENKKLLSLKNFMTLEDNNINLEYRFDTLVFKTHLIQKINNNHAKVYFLYDLRSLSSEQYKEMNKELEKAFPSFLKLKFKDYWSEDNVIQEERINLFFKNKERELALSSKINSLTEDNKEVITKRKKI